MGFWDHGGPSIQSDLEKNTRLQYIRCPQLTVPDNLVMLVGQDFAVTPEKSQNFHLLVAQTALCRSQRMCLGALDSSDIVLEVLKKSDQKIFFMEKNIFQKYFSR